jgi:hypothetical protein
MVNWQVTATTIYCDAVDDEVTIMVQKDWSIRCTGYYKYSGSNEGSASLKKKAKKIKRQLKCEGQECFRVTRYKESLLKEETGNGDWNQARTE